LLPTVTDATQVRPDRPPLHYQIVKFASGFSPFALSRHGVMLGSVGAREAVYDRGRLTYLRLPRHYTILSASGVNDRGVAVGYVDTNGGAGQPEEWVHGRPYPLQTAEPPSTPFYASSASFINDRDQIVGISNAMLGYGYYPEFLGAIVFYSRSAPPQVLDACCGEVNSLNDSGAVAGYEQISNYPPENGGFLLGATGCSSSATAGMQNIDYFGLTDRGHVIAEFASVNQSSSAVLYLFCHGSKVSALSGTPLADNDRDYIVGSSGSYAYLRTPDGQYYNLNDLLPAGSPPLSAAVAIDDRGEIITESYTGSALNTYLLAPSASCAYLFKS
jgi:hypothetical protein